MAGPIDAASDGLTIGSNGQITGGLSIAPTAAFGASVNGYTTGPCVNSYLFLDGNAIDVEVVPEPQTLTLLAAGLALATLLRRRVRR